MEKKASPMSMIMSYAAPYKSKYTGSVIFAVIGVISGMVPYFAVAQMVAAMLAHEEKDISFYLQRCILRHIYICLAYRDISNDE